MELSKYVQIETTLSKLIRTGQHLWESSSIEFYLAEKHNLLPTSLFEKANALSIVSSLFSLRDEIATTVNLPTAELRGEKHKKHIQATIPGLLVWHEKLLEESGGKFYAGDKVSSKIVLIRVLAESN